MYRGTSLWSDTVFHINIFIDKVDRSEELVIVLVFRLFTTHNREQLDQNELAIPLAGPQCVPKAPAPPSTEPRAVLPAPVVNDNGPRIACATNDDLHNRAHAYNPEGKASMAPPKNFELYKMIPQTVELCYKAAGIFAYACFFLVQDDFLVWDDGTDMRPTLAYINTR